MPETTPVVTIFGSSKVDREDPEYQKAHRLGDLLARNGYTVCNGGYGGIMEASARGAKTAGGKTLGITTEQFPGKVNAWIDREIKTPSWQERLFKLIGTGNAYVVCNGGTGTLVELFVVWEMTNKRMIRNPIVLYGSLMKELKDRLGKEKDVLFNDYLRMAQTPEEVLEKLK